MNFRPELIKDGVVKVDVSSIGTKFENFVQAGCRDLGSHRSRNVYCRKPIILPNLVLFFGTFLELPVLPSITCGFGALCSRGLVQNQIIERVVYSNTLSIKWFSYCSKRNSNSFLVSLVSIGWSAGSKQLINGW